VISLAAVAPLPFRRLDGDTTKPTWPTEAKVIADDKMFYVAFRCTEPAPDALKSQPRDRDGPIWSDDCVEVFIKAGGQPTREYCHLGTNPHGSLYDAYAGKTGWDSGARVAVHKGEGFWSVEMAIPLARMKLPTDEARLAGPWRLNLTRARPARDGQFTEETALAPTESGSSHVPAKFAYAFFEAFGGKLPARGR